MVDCVSEKSALTGRHMNKSPNEFGEL